MTRERVAAAPPNADAAALASMIELAHDAVLVSGPGGRIVFWNRGAEELYGWVRRQAVGRIADELLPTEFPEPLRAIRRQLVATGGWDGELRRRTKRGKEVVVDSRWGARLDDRGRLAAIVQIDRDVTRRVVAERERELEAARLRAIVEASLDAILLTAPDGRIFAANPAAEAMFGRSEAEIVAGGRELLVDMDDPRLRHALAERAQRGRVRADVSALRRDGTPFEVELSSVVFREPSGELRTSMVVHDVSARVEALAAARESEARFRALADASSEAVVIHDGGRILDVNRAARALFGHPEERLRQLGLRDLVPPDETARVQSLIDAGTEGPYETRALTADGRELVVEVSARAISYEGRSARVVTMRDVTETRRARLALEQQNERLRELDELKSGFVALVSHELRTPLTSILGYLDLLAAEPSDERRGEYLAIVGRNAHRLRRLVDDLLFVAHADEGPFPLERRPVPLADVARAIVDALQPAAAEAGVELCLWSHGRAVVDADADRIAQMLENLVANALKFTQRGGSVDVRVSRRSGRAVAVVADTGPGIPAEEQERLFERFYRGRAAVAAAKPGAGLGLAIVRQIVEAHGGTIRVESDGRSGSTFVVSLPLAG